MIMHERSDEDTPSEREVRRKLDAHPEGHEEKGKPEAVNLEREEPVSTGARRKDSF